MNKKWTPHHSLGFHGFIFREPELNGLGYLIACLAKPTHGYPYLGILGSCDVMCVCHPMTEFLVGGIYIEINFVLWSKIILEEKYMSVLNLIWNLVKIFVFLCPAISHTVRKLRVQGWILVLILPRLKFSSYFIHIHLYVLFR